MRQEDKKYAAVLAAKINAADTWGETEEELDELCALAGLADAWKASTPDNFEKIERKRRYGRKILAIGDD